MTAPVLTFAQTAAELRLSPDRFRKVWEKFVRKMGFPAPFRRPPESNYAWDAAEVAEWKARRARCGLGPSPAANDVHPQVHPLDQTTPTHAVASNPTLQRQRNELAAMMRRGA